MKTQDGHELEPDEMWEDYEEVVVSVKVNGVEVKEKRC